MHVRLCACVGECACMCTDHMFNACTAWLRAQATETALDKQSKADAAAVSKRLEMVEAVLADHGAMLKKLEQSIVSATQSFSMVIVLPHVPCSHVSSCLQTCVQTHAQACVRRCFGHVLCTAGIFGRGSHLQYRHVYARAVDMSSAMPTWR